MMGVDPATLSWWEYGGLKHEWAERHSDEDDEPVDLPSEEMVALAIEQLRNSSLTH